MLARCSMKTLLAALAALAATSVAALGATTGLGRFLLRSHDETGFVVDGHPKTAGSLNAWLNNVWGEPAQQRAVDSKRLRAEHFRRGMWERTSGPQGAMGVSWVMELGSSAAARREANFQFQSGFATQPSTPKRFGVPGVPGARGYVSGGGRTGGAANVVWAQGRCTFLVGDYRPGAGSLTGPVTAGAKAIHRRTHGKCP